MSYNSDERLAYLGRRMKAVRPEIIRYARGMEYIDTLVACTNATEQTEFMEGVPITQAHFQDWMIDSADLVLPTSGLILPRQGDVITRISKDNAIYLVTSLEDHKPPFEYTLPDQLRMRIHTVRKQK